jgi:hypothetical protein
MGTNDPNLLDNNVTTDIDRVERLFVGDDSTSVGTLFTNNQQTPTKQHSTNSTRSHSTTMTMEDVERNMNALSSDMAYIKTMMQRLVSNQATNEEAYRENNNDMMGEAPMEITTDNQYNKRKAGDSDIGSTCNSK